MIDFKVGDLFSVPLPDGKHVAGRVVLDVSRQCVQPHRIGDESPLIFFDGCILVEVCAVHSNTPTFDPSHMLLMGIFIDDRALRQGQWKIFDHQPVDPLLVEFPEGLTVRDRAGLFQRGEITLPVDLSMADVRRIDVFPTINGSGALPSICLYYLGLQHLIPHGYPEAMRLDHSDLRFSEHRHMIYRLLGENEHQSYAAMAARFGHDITRFYS